MSELQQLVSLIRDTEAELARAESAIVSEGLDFALELSTDSLRHRLEELQSEFSDLTVRQEIDVCTYRLIPNSGGRYPLSAIGRIFMSFQDLFTVLYDGIKREQQHRTTKVAPESAREAGFDFGYSFAGSLGFVLLLQNEQMLLGESVLDLAMSTLMQFPKADSTAQVSALAKKYGPAPVRLAYQWALAQADAGFSVEVQWKRGSEIRYDLFAHAEELHKLTDLIASTSDVEVQRLSEFGKLVGIDTAARTFHLIIDSKRDIRGSLHESFKPPQPFTIDAYYTAELELQRRIRYATDAEDRAYTLLALNSGFMPGALPVLGSSNALAAPDDSDTEAGT